MPNFNRHDPIHHEKLKAVLAKQGVERWQAAAQLYLWLNPRHIHPESGVTTADAQTINREIIASNQAARQSLKDERLGRSEGGSQRMALRMPQGMLQFIEMIQPDLFSGQPHERKHHLHQLMRAFPEYRIPRQI